MFEVTRVKQFVMLFHYDRKGLIQTIKMTRVLTTNVVNVIYHLKMLNNKNDPEKATESEGWLHLPPGTTLSSSSPPPSPTFLP